HTCTNPQTPQLSMKPPRPRTAPCGQIVKKAGKPEVNPLWLKPAQDRHLQSEIKNNRVMTILNSESGSEFGMVGFKQQKEARYLVFPKGLKRFENHRIVGINWDLVKTK